MIFIFSDEKLFIKSCSKILNEEQIQLIDIEKITNSLDLLGNNDLLILDLNMINISELPRIDCPAIALSNIPKYDEAMIMLHLGIRGYGNKYMLAENLIQAIQTVKTGQVWLPPSILTSLISKLPNSTVVNEPLNNNYNFTEREFEVTKHIIKGLSNKEISENMDITLRTVKSHLTSIFNKTGFRDRLELAINLK